jgi:hypothetical protein
VTVPWLLAAALLGLAGACANREHIRDDFGVKTRTFLTKQHVHAEAATDSPTGLDSEEAALIQSSYRNKLGGDARPGESDQVLVIEEPKASKEKK